MTPVPQSLLRHLASRIGRICGPENSTQGVKICDLLQNAILVRVLQLQSISARTGRIGQGVQQSSVRAIGHIVGIGSIRGDSDRGGYCDDPCCRNCMTRYSCSPKRSATDLY